MIGRGSRILSICIALMQLLQLINCQLHVDPEIRAQLEEKVMSSMSLKDIEEMVEQDERVLNAPKSKFIIIPKPKSGEGRYDSEELDQKAYIIQRKPKKYPKKAYSGYGLPGREFEDGFRRASLEPRFRFESAFKYDEEFPSMFGIADLNPAGSSPVKSFYESIVEKVLGESKSDFVRDPMAVLEMAASQDVPSYKPRFNYDSYARDPTETKLRGKTYWEESPEPREDERDENGCRTVVKKIMDPEDEKKYNAKPKSVIITKECEYPNTDGPDAKIPQIEPVGASQLEPEPSTNFDREVPSYENSRPIQLDLDDSKAKDALAPDYIDKMLETHFRSFPSFGNPISSFRGYQERFKLRTPAAFKEIKPTVGVQSYEYSHPQSGFEDQSDRESLSDLRKDSPRPYERQVDYKYPESPPRQVEPGYEKVAAPKVHEHHYHYEYPEKSPRKSVPETYDDEKEDQRGGSKYSEKKDPKMMKKSFAYYRKDNPKEDPNDQHYAEEYAQGNYRSFSSDYDSERDGPKKA